MNTAVKPPDGGWGWVVVASSCIISFIMDGICFSMGIFFQPFMDYYGTTKTEASWVGSVLSGTLMLIGPLTACLVHTYGCRNVAMSGSLFAAASIFISSFSPNICVLTFTLGFMGGIGVGLVFLPSVIIVGHYFEERRCLATGIACCGSGIGVFAFPPFCNFLLEEYNWKGATWIVSGLALNCVAFSILFLPVHMTTKKNLAGSDINQECVLESASKESPSVVSKSRVTHLISKRGVKDSLADVLETSEEDVSTLQNSYNVDAGHAQRQTDEIPLKTANDISKNDSTSEPNLENTNSTQVSNDDRNDTEKTSINQRALRFLRETPNLEFHRYATNIPGYGRTRTRDRPYLKRFSLFKPDDERTVCILNQTQIPKRKSKSTVTHSDFDPNPQSDRSYSRRNTFHRVSILQFPVADLAELVETRSDFPDDLERLHGRKWRFNRQCLLDSLHLLFDLSLLKSYTFLLYGFSCSLTMAGYLIPYIYLPALANDIGIQHAESSYLISIIGISNSLGLIVAGHAADRHIDNVVMTYSALFISGATTCTVPFLKVYPLLALYSFVFGFSAAVFMASRVNILVELFCLERLAHAFGLVIMLQGCATFFGSPIGGLLSDIYGEYNAAFYFSGVTMIVSGLVCVPLRWVASREMNSTWKTAL